jgi:hypothetical protein
VPLINAAELAEKFGPMGAHCRRNKPSRRTERVKKTASTTSAADAEGRDSPPTSETPEKLPRLPQRLRPRTVPRGSQRDPDIRDTVSRYVDSLIQLYEMTDPAQGPASEDNKLEYARQAVSDMSLRNNF